MSELAEDSVREETVRNDAMPEAAPADVAPADTPAEVPLEIAASSDEPTVGQSLRTAREAARLSVEDVAQALKFSVRQIELLEADNYAALPGTTIVRGFTRSYARLLKLDDNALLRKLDARTPSVTSDVRPPENMGIAEDGEAPTQFSALASVAIVIGLATVLLGVWHYFGQAVKTAAPAAVESHPGALPVQPVAVPAVVSAEPAAAVQPATNVAAPESDKPNLKFVFEGRSWLEVTDAAKQVLHTGENLPGSQLSLSGQPPFDIVIGNAAKVKLTYGDRAVDLAPHTRAEVARLKVE